MLLVGIGVIRDHEIAISECRHDVDLRIDCSLAGVVGRLAGTQQRLGRNARPVGTLSAGQLAFDDSDAQSSLGQLTRALAQGERDAEQAAGALDDIARVFERSAADSQETHDGDGGPGGRRTQAATLLARYLGQRAIALDSLPRLQRLTELRRPAPAPARPGPWQAIRAWMRTKIRRHAAG